MKLYVILAAAAGLAVLLAISHGAAYRAGKAIGRAGTIETITGDNHDAAEAAEERRAALRRCTERGGVFDHEGGTCDR